MNGWGVLLRSVAGEGDSMSPVKSMRVMIFMGLRE